MALALARDLALRGLRPALLAYRLGPGDGSGTDPIEVGPDSDWRATSEEAVLLRRESGLRVFATRDRARAWQRLASLADGAGGEAAFDILISDDGFQDPRLDGAFRILLMAPGENPGLFDLLPGGAFRETASARARADLVLEGPWSAPAPRIPDEPGTVTDKLPNASRFYRRLVLPAGLDPVQPCIIHCALGDNRHFLADLGRAGIRAVAVVTGRNHGPAPLELLRAAAARHSGAPILCTRKEAIKLDGIAHLRIQPVDQNVLVPDFVIRHILECCARARTAPMPGAVLFSKDRN